MADGVWKGVPPGFWTLPSIFAKFDPSTLSMRKGRDGEEKKKRKENMFLLFLGTLPFVERT